MLLIGLSGIAFIFCDRGWVKEGLLCSPAGASSLATELMKGQSDQPGIAVDVQRKNVVCPYELAA